MFESKKDLIKKLVCDFQTENELNQFITNIFIEEFLKPGLILLPVGKTFETGIYPLIDKHFQAETLLSRDLHDSNEELVKAKQQYINPELYLSHIDELINNEKNTFANRLRNSLPNVISQANERFYAIDINSYEDFDRFVKIQGGPRLILMGLGEDDSTAHVAFIGEEFINTTTTMVNLSEKTSNSLKCSAAVTIGTDIFKFPSIEGLIVVAKGRSKAESLKAAFEGPDTGLGYLINNHRNKLKIYADREAMALLS